jgi:uncharacterized protein (DUF1778 family)
MPAPARFDLKLEKDEKELLSQAAALMGTTMAGFVRTAAKEKARALLEQEQRVTMSSRDLAGIVTALDRAFAPNKALKGAMKRARETVRRA